ncbi:hypothetical protein GGR54DRAFT_511776 [Hypoxylon sp. NC1633]|nr:hypothetical protein GGR54DRAFT_511776 [Hypoxylon sp. NC1633]
MSDSGGTLTLPSPTHPQHNFLQHVESLRSLRRSISRSPSKFTLSRTASQSSSEPGSSPSSPSIRRVQSQYFGQNTSLNSPLGSQPHAQSPLATPFRPSTKLSLRSAKSTKSPSSSTFNKPFSRHRTSPKSPSRRALNLAPSTSGNSIPSFNPSSSTSIDPIPSGQENINIFRTRSPAPRKATEKAANRHSMHLDMSGSSLSATRVTEFSNTMATATGSPLKRSDVTMSLDQSLSGSPKAKRRSYGPSNLSIDFNVFDCVPTSTSTESQDESAREYDWTGFTSPSVPESPSASLASAAMRRAGSLRKSTLQQRERTSWGKRHAAQQLGQNSGDVSTPQRDRSSGSKRHGAQQLAQGSRDIATPNGKARPRLSLDHFMPPPPRDSPFNAPGPLPNPSAHILNQQGHQPHPLSNAITNSSSSSSFDDDKPTDLPVMVAEGSRAPVNFSKSLPIGGSRAKFQRPNPDVSTPDYAHAKPYEGAFASTGLVSKMNRNPEKASPIGDYGAVPDTPCKKNKSGFATYPPLPLSGNPKRGRHMRHTFGISSTPFDPSTPDRSANIFANYKQNLTQPVPFSGMSSSRQGSVLNLYNNDGRHPVRGFGGRESSNDSEMPPTPTKQGSVPRTTARLGQLPHESPTANRRLPIAMSAAGVDTAMQQGSPVSCKYRLPKRPCDGRGCEDEDIVPADNTLGSPSPAIMGTPPTIVLVPSFSQSRALRGSCCTPTPVKTMSMGAIEPPSQISARTKTCTPVPASPLEQVEFAEKASPKTPQGNIVPPDASRLSISNATDGLLFPSTGNRNTTQPPATPTAKQDGTPILFDRRAITPINGMPSHDLDEALMARFAKVEFLGKGEFSVVYKVTDYSQPSRMAQPAFVQTPTYRTPSPPAPNVYAVKKLTLPILGRRDRANRLREVSVLESLKGCEHILYMERNWEDNNCLYIQTEYCSEGSLDAFLSYVGEKGRLDDFRIWKIMYEIAKGLRQIHLAGFIHLDLKPANVFIDFEGILKIGDFGLSTVCPFDRGPDMEGDRQYMAPEALRSEIGQVADVFSLGLIILEIAANVKLPENGSTWSSLREDDFAEVPTLTQGNTVILRDIVGMPIDDTEHSVNLFGDNTAAQTTRRNYNLRNTTRQSGDIFGLGKKNYRTSPPDFMMEPSHPNSIDTVVKLMLTSNPDFRPSIHHILTLDAITWVAARQHAGATVYEGDWGPADDTPAISLDTEMTDV